MKCGGWRIDWSRRRAEASTRLDLVRRVDVRLPEQGNASSHGARPVHLIIAMMKWIRTSRLSIKKSPSLILARYPQKTLIPTSTYVRHFVPRYCIVYGSTRPGNLRRMPREAGRSRCGCLFGRRLSHRRTPQPALLGLIGCGLLQGLGFVHIHTYF